MRGMFGLSTIGMRLRAMVVAALEDQRFARFDAAAFDLADEDDMVALLVAAAVEAFEPPPTAFEDRRAARALAPRDPGEAVETDRFGSRRVPPLRSEPARQLDLVGGEDVDRVGRHVEEGREARR